MADPAPFTEQDARDFAAKYPNDPRSARIRQKLNIAEPEPPQSAASRDVEEAAQGVGRFARGAGRGLARQVTQAGDVIQSNPVISAVTGMAFPALGALSYLATRDPVRQFGNAPVQGIEKFGRFAGEALPWVIPGGGWGGLGSLAARAGGKGLLSGPGITLTQRVGNHILQKLTGFGNVQGQAVTAQQLQQAITSTYGGKIASSAMSKLKNIPQFLKDMGIAGVAGATAPEEEGDPASRVAGAGLGAGVVGATRGISALAQRGGHWMPWLVGLAVASAAREMGSEAASVGGHLFPYAAGGAATYAAKYGSRIPAGAAGVATGEAAGSFYNDRSP